MSTIVKVDGVGKIKFPDSMSHTEIQDFLDKKYGSKRKTEGFWESRAKAKDQAAEDYAIGKLALENDKNFNLYTVNIIFIFNQIFIFIISIVRVQICKEIDALNSNDSSYS